MPYSNRAPSTAIPPTPMAPSILTAAVGAAPLLEDDIDEAAVALSVVLVDAAEEVVVAAA